MVCLQYLRRENKEDLDGKQMIIYDMMARLQVDYETASLFYEDELDEFKRLSKMNSYEFMQHVKDEKEAEQARYHEQFNLKHTLKVFDSKARKLAFDRYVEKDQYQHMFNYWFELGRKKNPFTQDEIDIIIGSGIKTKEELEKDIEIINRHVQQRIDSGEYDPSKPRDYKN